MTPKAEIYIGHARMRQGNEKLDRAAFHAVE